MLSATTTVTRPATSSRLRRLIPAVAFALVTIGAAIPLVMMLNGVIADGTDYALWTWPAIPAAWLPAAAGALLIPRREATGAILLVIGAALGIAFFWQEYAVFTFAPAWALGAWSYLDTGRRRGWLG